MKLTEQAILRFTGSERLGKTRKRIPPEPDATECCFRNDGSRSEMQGLVRNNLVNAWDKADYPSTGDRQLSLTNRDAESRSSLETAIPLAKRSECPMLFA